jgi:GLPGLI family protein
MKIKMVFAIFIILIFFTIKLQAQEIIVNYRFKFLPENLNRVASLAILNDSVSVFEIDEKEEVNDEKLEQAEGTNDFSVKLSVYLNRKIIKHFNNNEVHAYIPDDVDEKKYNLIIDTLNAINWQLSNETKNILKYPCKKAMGTFKSFKFTAWYCPDLIFTDGPWKFNGLPGLILQLDRDDQNLQVSAIEIIQHPEIKKKYTLTEPYLNKFNWPAYVSYMKKYYEKMNNMMSAVFANVENATVNEISINLIDLKIDKK